MILRKKVAEYGAHHFQATLCGLCAMVWWRSHSERHVCIVLRCCAHLQQSVCWFISREWQISQEATIHKFEVVDATALVVVTQRSQLVIVVNSQNLSTSHTSLS